jgi:hypothetical protein
MSDDQVIDHIIESFSEFNLRDIVEINNHPSLEFTIAEFTLCSCLIDQLSGFRYNTDKVGRRYRQFVKEYLPQYNPDELYNDLRNRLVHNYSLGSFYGLIRKAPQLHLKKVNGVTVLNLENFIEDLRKVLIKYSLELKTNNDIRRRALGWFSEYRIIGVGSQI